MVDPVVVAKHSHKMDLAPGTYHWCACGRSKNQPFCDGAHQGTGLGPVEFKVEQAQRFSLCLCKHTGDRPRCDGTHRDL